jgi:Holliday junction resolvasome RuvABC endonuclease subunit
MTLKILALDISSTHIGVCYDGQPLATWALAAKLNIAERCRLAAKLARQQLDSVPDVDLVVIERPAGRHTNGIIQPARVSGAILVVLSEQQLAWCEISPADAKKVLAGKGNAKKPEMIEAAARALGQQVDEHAADAYALWLAGCTLKATKEAA